MQPQRETMTDCLADIIHIIHLGGKSGTLTVERGEGQTLEEGFIVFVEGRVIAANSGRQSGIAAFNYLSSWMKCHFSFTNHPVNNLSGTQIPALLPAPSSQGKDPRSRSATGNTSSLTSVPAAHRRDDQYQNRIDSSLQSVLPFRLEAGEIALQRPDGVSLPRAHRRLLLLVNGQRSVGELARLTARSYEEVQQQLRDLERAGLIRQ